jgi:SAM-dependent methyltransferase
VLPAEDYLRLYKDGAANQWRGDEGRRDLQLIRRLIAERPATASVLDIGCGNGDFLAGLPAALAKFGIEPSVAAARQAASRGIVIASGSLTDLEPERRFDVITLIDVIEHVPDPSALLDLAARHLQPGGVIIVSTGDPQSTAWRWFAARFWYVTYPEHLSFPSRRFFELWQARRASGAGPVRQITTAYQTLSAWTRVLYSLIQVAYYVSPAAFHRIGRVGLSFTRTERRRRFFAPSAPGVFTDHQVVMLQCTPAPNLQNRKSA